MFSNITEADTGGSAVPADPQLLTDLVDANHILYAQGVLDAFGHVSVRHNATPDRFLLSRSMAPALVKREDILEFKLDGDPLDAQGRRVYLERFIHASIYASRPDVVAVVHSHSSSVIPFGVMEDLRLQPIYHMAGFIGGRIPIFEIREFAGDGTDLLIRSTQLGDDLAGTLKQSSIVLMRGHGFVVVANSLRNAVYRAVYTEMNARIQLSATSAGKVNYLTESEAIAAEESNAGQIDRAWGMWLRSMISLV